METIPYHPLFKTFFYCAKYMQHGAYHSKHFQAYDSVALAQSQHRATVTITPSRPIYLSVPSQCSGLKGSMAPEPKQLVTELGLESGPLSPRLWPICAHKHTHTPQGLRASGPGTRVSQKLPVGMGLQNGSLSRSGHTGTAF